MILHGQKIEELKSSNFLLNEKLLCCTSFSTSSNLFSRCRCLRYLVFKDSRVEGELASPRTRTLLWILIEKLLNEDTDQEESNASLGSEIQSEIKHIQI